MDGAKLQQKIYKGYGQAAKRIGFDYQQFRATGANNPLNSNPLQTLSASFTTNFSYSAPNKYGQAAWLGLFDASLCAPGDILIGEGGTFFIAAMQSTLPIYCIQTNRKITVLRVSMGSGVGVQLMPATYPIPKCQSCKAGPPAYCRARKARRTLPICRVT